MYNVAATYDITDKLEVTAVVAEQRTSSNDQLYRPTTYGLKVMQQAQQERSADLSSFNFSSKFLNIMESMKWIWVIRI